GPKGRLPVAGPKRGLPAAQLETAAPADGKPARSARQPKRGTPVAGPKGQLPAGEPKRATPAAGPKGRLPVAGPKRGLPAAQLETAAPADGKPARSARQPKPERLSISARVPSSPPPFESYPAIVIEDVWPEIDGGRWPIKRVVGDTVEVWADIFKEGHDVLSARVLYRRYDQAAWQVAPMQLLANDRWYGHFAVGDNTRYHYTVEAYTDVFGSWRADLEKRVAAGQDVSSELLEGRRLVEQALERADQRAADALGPTSPRRHPKGSDGSVTRASHADPQSVTRAAQKRHTVEVSSQSASPTAGTVTRASHGGAEGVTRLRDVLRRWDSLAANPAEAVALATSAQVGEVMASLPDLTDATRYRHELEVFVDRPAARFAAWYEIFPRSQGSDPTRSATFREAEARLPAIANMGFNVLYLTPIHPIGQTNRKGPNNSLHAGPSDPGSPYAIGSAAGGHDAVAPELGTLDDFLHFQQRARALGMELALDFAIQVSPDHPWVGEHPEWFYHRPDGTIKYAENPPKKYEDIYPLNFRTPDWKALWAALRDIVVVWAERGVRIFRVDNPHTKPLAFWEWLIRDVQSAYPDAIFMAEAFTRPKMMKALGKAGFTQSYTYFTWRNTKAELTEYLTELTQTPMREYYRGNFFANTPDILPHVLQFGGRPAFRMRLVLASTLSSLYGIYSGFELCENTPRGLPGTTEYYQDSEMYQHKVWDWDRAGNIIDDVRRVNRIRRENPALQLYDNLRFYGTDNDQVLAYGKATPDGSNVILCVVNLDPYWSQSAWLDVPIQDWGLGADASYVVHDLLNDARYPWRGRRNWVRLDPRVQPAHVFRVEPA
ncbi:MAG TPA: maltotransferase domain-containing protein, partial [Chloroflexota bacterium]|nr:maltotransferase domain-containing protein [Chloroflexota bacterium]